MKKVFFLTLLSFWALSSFAQHETLFGRARVVGGFGAPIVEFGLGKNNDIRTSVGGGGGVVISDVFLGGYGLGSVDFDALLDDEKIESLDIGHGGFWLGYTFKPYKILHLFGSAKIGWGAVNIRLNDGNIRFDDLDKIFVFTPELGVELNVTKWFRLAGTAGYRWIDGANESFGYTNDDFSGAVAAVTLRFGWFGWRRN